jgi:predicted metal-dependent peptidase
MGMFDFNTWEKIRQVCHERGNKRFIGINVGPNTNVLREQEDTPKERKKSNSAFGTPEPGDFSKEELLQIEKKVRTNVSYAIGNIVKSHPFFAVAIMKIKYVYTYRFDTAAIDGGTMFINPLFFNMLSPKAIQFVVMHELMHCMLLHFLRMMGRNHETWNQATDFEINLIVAEELNYDMMSDPILKIGCYDKQYIGMNAEEIYKKLSDQSEQPDDKEGDQQGEGKGEGEGGKATDGSQIKKNQVIGEVVSPAEGRKVLDQEGISKNQQINNQTEEDWRKMFEEGAVQRENARRASATGAGGLLDNLIKEMIKPKVNWKKALAGYIGEIITGERLRMPAKRYISKGEYRSKNRPYAMVLDKVVVAIDTSISMHKYVGPLFFEISGILKQENIDNIDLLYFDTKVDYAEKLKKGGAPDPTKITGGGGTLFMPVINWISQKIKGPELVIIMSDGDNFDTTEFYDKKPGWKRECIWLIVGKPNWVAPYGKVIHITPERLLSK